MSDRPVENLPDDTVTLNGHTYISERALSLWGTIEVMVRNPAVSERIADLEARLEKAEAERDEAREDAVEAFAVHFRLAIAAALREENTAAYKLLRGLSAVCGISYALKEKP